MTSQTFTRVMAIRKRKELWLKSSFLEDEENKTSQREAVRLIRMAVHMGEREALGSLANAYDTGRGVRPSRRMALRSWHKAWRVRLTSGMAARNIGVTLRTEGRITSAISWFRKAIEARDPDARLDLAKLYLQIPARHKDAQQLLAEFVAAGPQKIYLLRPGEPPVPTEDESFLEGQQLLRKLTGPSA